MAALINVPKKAKRGDVIEIKTLMSHIMETGYRHTTSGELVPRDIITSFACRFNGQEIFRADLFPATAANPFFSFFTVASESGKLTEPRNAPWVVGCCVRPRKSYMR